LTEAEKQARATAAAQPLVAALMPMGCLMGAVVALFWLTMILLAIFCVWIWTLPAK
jgi:hypothetical protein